MKAPSLVGQVFGRLTVTGEAPPYVSPVGKRFAKWRCQCVCGGTVELVRVSLVSGRTQSCGCLNAELRTIRATKHGHKPREGKSPEYQSWAAMLTRCRNPHATGYPRYGGRGITVCERWSDFPAFLSDLGPRPEGMSLDRIDPNGNYEPGNCRWATFKAQANNTRRNRFVTWLGETRSVAEWADYLTLPKRNLWTWLSRAGWDMEKALAAHA